MSNVPVSEVRAFAIMGHTGSGKTSLTDALLHRMGVNDRLGSVDAGSSMSDYTDEEKAHRISIFAKPFAASYTSGEGRTFRFCFIDTPGYMDFFGGVLAATAAVETGLIAVDASAGVQVGTRRAWRCCEQAGKARAIVITGLDKENADFDRTVADIQASFGPQCVPAVLPLADRSGVVDVIGGKNPPADLAASVEAFKSSLIERAAETDDTLIEKFIGGESLSPEEIGKGLDQAMITGGVTPIFACCGRTGVGVTELLDGIARLFPSPLAVEHKDRDGQVIKPDPDAPFIGQVWHTVNDSFVGQLAYVRVFGGTLRSDSEVFNVDKGHKERIGAMLITNGKKQETVSSVMAGEIVALPKLKITAIGHTLGVPGSKTLCPPLVFPKPVFSRAVRAKTQADEDKLGTALQRICEEDPTLNVLHNAETKELVIQGLGDVHIDVAVELMKGRSHVEVLLDTPKVPYRETVTGVGEGHYKHKKQSGGRGQYGEVYLRVEPRRPDEEDWFVDGIVGGVIPNNFIPAVQKGLVEGMQTGSLAGYPVTHIKVTLYDGSYHDVDSSEIAFKIAGARALREGMSQARPVLLEPIMTVKVMIPDQFLGDINGDLNQKRGRILGMGSEAGMQVITAEVPQAELFRYAAELRSITGGQGTFEMEFSRYEQVPANVAQKVIAAAQKAKEED